MEGEGGVKAESWRHCCPLVVPTFRLQRLRVIFVLWLPTYRSISYGVIEAVFTNCNFHIYSLSWSRCGQTRRNSQGRRNHPCEISNDFRKIILFRQFFFSLFVSFFQLLRAGKIIILSTFTSHASCRAEVFSHRLGGVSRFPFSVAPDFCLVFLQCVKSPESFLRKPNFETWTCGEKLPVFTFPFLIFYACGCREFRTIYRSTERVDFPLSRHHDGRDSVPLRYHLVMLVCHAGKCFLTG